MFAMIGKRLSFVLAFSTLVVVSSEHGIKKFFDILDKKPKLPIPKVDVPAGVVGEGKQMVGDLGKHLLGEKALLGNLLNAAVYTPTKTVVPQIDVPGMEKIGNDQNMGGLPHITIPNVKGERTNGPEYPNMEEILKDLPPIDAEIQTVPDIKDLSKIGTSSKLSEKSFVAAGKKRTEVADSSATTCQVQVVVCCLIFLTNLIICHL